MPGFPDTEQQESGECIRCTSPDRDASDGPPINTLAMARFHHVDDQPTSAWPIS